MIMWKIVVLVKKLLKYFHMVEEVFVNIKWNDVNKVAKLKRESFLSLKAWNLHV